MEQLKIKQGKGITLISLIITIIILLILAGVTIGLVIGDNGLIAKSKYGIEMSEITGIKEKAEMVKAELHVNEFGINGGAEEVRKSILLRALNENFEESELQDNKVVTKGEKYDIIVRNNLEIIVVKHGKAYLEDGEIEMICYYDEGNREYSVNVDIYLEIGGEKTYDEYAREILNKLTDDKQKEDLFIESYKYYRFGTELPDEIKNITTFEQLMQYSAENDGFPEGSNVPKTIEEFKNFMNTEYNLNYENVDEMLIAMKYVKPKEYKESAYDIVVRCSNGDEVVTNSKRLHARFNIEENGSYTFTTTGKNGKESNITIKIDNIIGAKPQMKSLSVIRTSQGLNIKVDAENAARYQFKIDDSMSQEQDSNEYNYYIKYENGKGTSSTVDPYIPKGFKHIEGTVDEGYVISDLPKTYQLTIKMINSSGRNENTITKEITGNEFVWVPVDNDDSTPYPSLQTNGSLENDAESADSKSVQYFINSVNQNGGFYIGRYEAGMPGEFSGDEPRNRTSYRNFVGVPSSRKNIMPWNNITKINAKQSAESMYDLNKDEIQSQLVNIYAWNTVLDWFIKSESKTEDEINNDSSGWGNMYSSSYSYEGMYIEIKKYDENSWIGNWDAIRNGKITKNGEDEYAYVLPTGALNEMCKVKNIYDIAGNMEEFTINGNNSSDCSYGNKYNGKNYVGRKSVKEMTSWEKGTKSDEIGFRVIFCK